MTGYGRLNETNEKFDVNIELKSLNSKFLDLRMRLPNNLKSKEHAIKKLITEVIAETNASGPAGMGLVMKVLQPKIAGKADGGLVSGLVKAALSQ